MLTILPLELLYSDDDIMAGRTIRRPLEITQAEVNDDGESSDSEEEVQIIETQQSEDIIDENGNSDTESEPM